MTKVKARVSNKGNTDANKTCDSLRTVSARTAQFTASKILPGPWRLNVMRYMSRKFLELPTIGFCNFYKSCEDAT